MKFDKSKVCVAGLHEVPIGTKGYYSDEICNLRDYVKDEDKDMYGAIIRESQDDWYEIINKNGNTQCWHFFYPCEEQVNRYRPYKTLEEAMVLKGKWLKKKAWDEYFMVTRISLLGGTLLCNDLTEDVLYDKFVMEDGSPIGVEV
jgi:hypothetical protein